MNLLLQERKTLHIYVLTSSIFLLMSTYEYDVDPSKPHKYYSPADEHGQSCVPVSNEHLRANENNHVSGPVRNENARPGTLRPSMVKPQILGTRRMPQYGWVDHQTPLMPRTWYCANVPYSELMTLSAKLLTCISCCEARFQWTAWVASMARHAQLGPDHRLSCPRIL
jgi:hypothetical protein